jgi:hypothetical protein
MLLNRITRYIAVGCVIILMVPLSGCGKRGYPEAPLRPNEQMDKDGQRKKENARRPITVPDRSFILDPLL